MHITTVCERDADPRYVAATLAMYEAEFARGETPVFAGATLNPVAHPLGAPVITGTSITVDTMLQQPTRITQFLMDITLARFILDRIFTSDGGVTGGAVVFDLLTENELFLDRDVEPVSPGGEFPIVTSTRRAPRVAEVEKFGGKYFFTDEARDRNDATAFRNENIKLGNTIVRKLNARAVAEMDRAIAANNGASEFVGNDWSAAIPGGSNPTPPAGTPGADFARANLLADQRELGITYDIAIVNPVQLNELRLFYGGGLAQMLADNGYDEVYASNRVTVGTAYFVAEGQLGEMRLEQPLATETWRDAPTQRTWVQSSVRPVMFVNNPFAVVRATGL
jgi:hypothetical protein